MKKIILFITLLVIMFSATAQEKKTLNIPKRVKNRMTFTFPQTGGGDVPVKWEMIGPDYKASLKIMDKPCYILIDSLGKTIYLERFTYTQNLPPKALEYLKKQYPDMTITDVYQITDAQGKQSYRASIVVKPVVFFDPDGTLIPNKPEKK